MADADGKVNQDLVSVGGELILVSQFTLIAEIRSGNRPSFAHAAKGEKARKLFDELVKACQEKLSVKTGFFGEYMAVESINDGPVTLVLDTQKF
jgi:D-tyrosyl-tRNA(Tyr) deacylase